MLPLFSQEEALGDWAAGALGGSAAAHLLTVFAFLCLFGDLWANAFAGRMLGLALTLPLENSSCLLSLK